MPYVGKSPSAVGVRSRYYFTASGGETSLSGSDNNGKTLVFTDAAYVDVILNGNNLVSGTDYVAVPNTNTISGLAALVANDVVEIISYDVFSVADTVPASTGGTFSGGLTVPSLTTTGDISFGDNDKAIFGAGSDLQIYSDGANALINHSNTLAGALYLMGDNNVIISNQAGTENKAVFTTNGAVTLYYDNAAKLSTTASGCNVTGTITADGLTVDGGGTNFPITVTSTDQYAGITFVDNTTTNSAVVAIYADGDELGFEAGNAERMRIDASGNVGIGTASPATALDVTGSVTSDGLTVDGATTVNNADLLLNGSSPEIIFQTGATHYNWMVAAQENVSNALEISSGSQDGDYSNDTWTPRLVINSSGNVTAPYQPAFHVYHTLTVPSNTYIAHNSAIVNNGGHYNSTNGKFTAPVAGNYIFYATGLTQPTGSTSRMKLVKNGSTTVSGESRHQGGTAGAYLHATIQAVVYLAAGDWVQQYYINDDGSTTLYSDSSPYITFGGHLIG